MSEKYLKAIEKLALGYDYEEVQTFIEETDRGTKKKIVRTKKNMPPDFNAARFMMLRNEKREPEEQVKVATFAKEVF